MVELVARRERNSCGFYALSLIYSCLEERRIVPLGVFVTGYWATAVVGTVVVFFARRDSVGKACCSAGTDTGSTLLSPRAIDP